jgi:hypothetical protein
MSRRALVSLYLAASILVVFGSTTFASQSVGSSVGSFFKGSLTKIHTRRHDGAPPCDSAPASHWIAVDTSVDKLIETAINTSCKPRPDSTFDFPVRFRVVHGPYTGQRYEQTWRIDCRALGGRFQRTGWATAWDEHGKEVKHAPNEDPPNRWILPKVTDTGGRSVLKWACTRIASMGGPQ